MGAYVDNDDALTRTRLDVAEMKGMLTTVVGSHEARIHNLEQADADMQINMDHRSRDIARHDERLKNLEDDNSARWGRVTGILSLIVASGALLWTFIVPQ